jgi:hypothetical protein
MDAVRQLTLGALARYRLARSDDLFRLVCEPHGRTKSSLERVLSLLQRDQEIRSFAFDQRRKVYALSTKGARRFGLDERAFGRAPTRATMRERLSILASFIHLKQTVLTPEEFTALCPEVGSIEGFAKDRYFFDETAKQPVLGLLLVDHASETVARICYKARAAVEKRKEHKAWKVLIYPKLFRLAIATPTESKAEEIDEGLRTLTTPHEVVVVPTIAEFLS